MWPVGLGVHSHSTGPFGEDLYTVYLTLLLARTINYILPVNISVAPPHKVILIFYLESHSVLEKPGNVIV